MTWKKKISEKKSSLETKQKSQADALESQSSPEEGVNDPVPTTKAERRAEGMKKVERAEERAKERYLKLVNDVDGSYRNGDTVKMKETLDQMKTWRDTLLST